MIKRGLPIFLALIGCVVMVVKVDWVKTWGFMEKTNLLWCVAALIGLLIMNYIKGVRWSYLLKMQGYHYPSWDCFLVYMSSIMWGNVTLGRVGEFSKVLYAQRDLKLSLGSSMASIMIDRVFDLYLLLFLGCLGVLLNPISGHPLLIDAVWAFFGILIAITLLAFNQKVGGALLKTIFQKMMKQEHKEKTDKLFNDFHKGLESFYTPQVLYPVFLSILSYFFFFGGCYLLAVAMNLPINFFYLSACLSVVNIVSLVSFLGLGTRDGAFFILFSMKGLQDQSEAFSMLFFLVAFVIFSLIGLGCFYLKPMDMSFLSKKKEVPVKAVARRKTRKK